MEAGIARVVVASDDPTEKAAGRGLGILRDEGVEVEVADGDITARARAANQAFRKHARTGRPHVLFKSAMTLDGKVATATGDSKWISGEESRRLAHPWRAERDAVVVGIGTALHDDPQLTARHPVDPPVQRQPRRVVFDSEGRLRSPPSSCAGRSRCRSPSSSRARPRARAPTRSRRPAPTSSSPRAPTSPRACARRSPTSARTGITSMLLEGGPHLAGAFFDAGEIDELRLFVAPIVLGGAAARDPLEGEGAERIAEATRALSLDCRMVAGDVLISARLREW